MLEIDEPISGSSVFKNFGYGVLTERETELAILIIRGYSLIAIAEMLGIAHGTAKVHCKNLYNKLEINSKSELFSLFLDQISLTYPPIPSSSASVK